ncbi:hypothetical protein BT96DRAFT_1014417 [Gymnopus androsaceus JB14]|uniref:Homeobox domain-containing protein n=1 Tax=Gymnopus androsaceus JB14 TaxID=1447944 RepID=A0A6A4ID04_9AGAR|nr:hypothetical protein BT96DRAFT_1014417 [Gymnopus androsaceus JB14]
MGTNTNNLQRSTILLQWKQTLLRHSYKFLAQQSELPLPLNDDSAKRPRRLRIPKKGVEILNNAFKQVQDPTPIQKQNLLEQIKALPKCDQYQMKNLESWFRNAKRRSQSLPISPSIKPSKLKTLRTLFGSTPDPTEKVMSVWATLLGTELEVVEAWVSAAQDQFEPSHQSMSAHAPDFAHLPTPLSIHTSSRSPSPPAKRRKLSNEAPARLLSPVSVPKSTRSPSPMMSRRAAIQQ